MRLPRRSPTTRHEDTGELSLVPYLDVITTLVLFMVLSAAGLASYRVLNATATTPAAAQRGNSADDRAASLDLLVVVREDGYSVVAAGLRLDGPAPGVPTVPLREGRYDTDRLGQVIDELKALQPAETRVRVQPAPAVAYETLVATLDALREDGGEGRRPRFPDVALVVVGEE